MFNGSPGTNAPDMFLNLSIERAVALRQKNRNINSTKKHAEADRLKNEGNDLYKNANYLEAASRYVQATKLVGHTPVLMSNLAAAQLKLERFDVAEWAATVALLYDPHMTKARYRRGVARSKRSDNKSAHADFETVLIDDPHCAEADQGMENIQMQWDELEERMEDEEDDEVIGAMGIPGPLYGAALEQAVKPDFDDDPWELSSVDSDSRDCQHVGNGIPCRFYNSSSGCTRGEDCRFSHAPNDNSVRDRLGRNVCINHLFNACHFGNTCNYSHSKAFLKPGQWDHLDNTEGQVAEYEAARSQVAEIKKFTQRLCQIPSPGPVPTIRTWKWPGNRAQAVTEAPNRIVSATNQNRFILLLSLEDEEFVAGIHSHLLCALNSKIRAQKTLTSTAALSILDSPDLAGVFVTDAGVTRRRNKKVLAKLVEYAKAGGNVAVGGSFSSFVSSGEFDSFFKAWGLPWTRGSYHRTTHSLNPAHDTAGRNPSLVPKYSMKAVHAKNIRPSDAVYGPTDDSHLESMVFAPQPITDCSESPATHTRVGNGYLGYVGDVNAEIGSTNVILAMLGLLDAPHTPEPATAAVIPPTPFILVLSFDSHEYTNTHYGDLLSTLRDNVEVVHGLSRSRVMELIPSPDLTGILIMDSSIADAANAAMLERVIEFTMRGGNVVLSGLFSGALTPDEMDTFFTTNWDLPWSMSNYTNAEMVVNTKHPIANQKRKNKRLTPKYHAKSVFLSGIRPETAVYEAIDPHASSSPSLVRAAIIHTRMGKGHLGFIGDVNPSPVAKEVVLTMLGL